MTSVRPEARPGSRRPVSRSELSESAILAAFEEQLRTRPLAEVKIADVAAAAGLGRSAFYFYFSSREKAVAALLGDLFDEIAEPASAFLTGGRRDLTTLEETFTSLIATWGRHRHVLLAVIDASRSDPTVRAMWDEWLARFELQVREVIVDAGAATDAAGAADLAHALVSMNERVLERWSRKGAPSGEAADLAGTLVLIWARVLGV